VEADRRRAQEAVQSRLILVTVRLLDAIPPESLDDDTQTQVLDAFRA
jgi:hypothetical protein